jgi:nucleoside-diphosphate-sugar epimerase
MKVLLTAFNVGTNNENYRVRELAEMVCETFSGCEIQDAEAVGHDPHSYRVDFSKPRYQMPR